MESQLAKGKKTSFGRSLSNVWEMDINSLLEASHKSGLSKDVHVWNSSLKSVQISYYRIQHIPTSMKSINLSEYILIKCKIKS